MKIRQPKELCGYAGMPDDEYNRRWFARIRVRSITNENGCFVWQGPKTSKGYPMMTHRGYQTSGHRIAYMLTYKVELGREQFVCHRCDERRCWNPEHMFIGDTAENQQDSIAKKRQRNTKKTHCWRGHPFSGDNVNFVKGGRQCKACCTGNQRVYNGWPEHLAYTLPAHAKLPEGTQLVKYVRHQGTKEKPRAVIR